MVADSLNLGIGILIGYLSVLAICSIAEEIRYKREQGKK
jgi:hypothetical protein